MQFCTGSRTQTVSALAQAKTALVELGFDPTNPTASAITNARGPKPAHTLGVTASVKPAGVVSDGTAAS